MANVKKGKNYVARRCTHIALFLLPIIILATVILYSTLGYNSSTHSETLKAAIILFRHGEKNPTSLYPTDPHNAHQWKGGKGALTAKGIQQLYQLGTVLHKYYSHLLPKDGVYSQDNMFVISSYAERCIMSAQALLAGFMPPSTILPLNWQPVSITSLPRLDDTILAQKKPCTKYDTILKSMYSNPPPDLKELNMRSKELYKDLSLHTGKTIKTVLDVEFLYNTLKAEEELGLQLPAWTKEFYPNRLLPLAKRSYTLFTDNDYMRKIKGGGFLNEVNSIMTGKFEGELNPDRNLFFYSGHDVTLINVMNSLMILNQTSDLPEFGATLVFELHEPYEAPGQYEVKMRYFVNEQSLAPIHINIPNCPGPCLLDEFSHSIKHLLFDDYNAICENTKEC